MLLGAGPVTGLIRRSGPVPQGSVKLDAVSLMLSIVKLPVVSSARVAYLR